MKRKEKYQDGKIALGEKRTAKQMEAESCTKKNTETNVTNAVVVPVKTDSDTCAYHRLPLLTPNNCVALDCEFVGCGPRGSISYLGRCSIVNFNGKCLLDIYAQPGAPVTDYRYRHSGLRPQDFKSAVPFDVAQAQIKSHIEGKILVGHDIKNDLRVLKLTHPPHMIRDTLKHPWIKKQMKKRALKNLAWELLGLRIQHKKHCSLEDARVTMKVMILSERALRRLPASCDASDVSCMTGDDSAAGAAADTAKRRRTESEHSLFEDHYWPDLDDDLPSKS